MKQYIFDIIEYQNEAKNLDNTQDLIYRRLIDLQYLTESPIPDDIEKIAGKIGFSPSKPTMGKIETVLQKFFTLGIKGWELNRVTADIMANAKKPVRRNPNVLTPSPRKSVTINASRETLEVLNLKGVKTKHDEHRPDGISDQVWLDFVKHRARHRAEITHTAMKGFYREASNAGIGISEAISISIERNWVGFKAEWIKNHKYKPAKADTNNETSEQKALRIFGNSSMVDVTKKV